MADDDDDDDASNNNNNNNNNNKTSPASSLRVSDLATVFSDLTPVPQNDDDDDVAASGVSGGGSCCCRIDYSDDFRLAYDYFRAVLRANEHSERALALTALCLEFNPANYTVWHFRRRILLLLQEEEEEEQSLQQRLPVDLALTARLGGPNPKNYQIWYHRRALLEELLLSSRKQEELQQEQQDALADYCQKELAYIGTVLAEDAKNYHAWSHRQWVVQTMAFMASSARDNDNTNDDDAAAAAAAVFESELEYTEQLIQSDPRNNSAWNHRWFAAHKGGRSTSLLSLADARAEADYALSCARLDPYNECPFRYLVAVLNEQRRSSNDDHNVSLLLNEYEQKTWGVQQVLVDHGKDADSSVPLIAAVLDMLEWKGDDKVSLEKFCELSNKLAVEGDPIRQKYWTWRREQVQEALSKLPSSSSSSPS